MNIWSLSLGRGRWGEKLERETMSKKKLIKKIGKKLLKSVAKELLR